MKWVKKGFRCPMGKGKMVISECKKCEYFELDFDVDKKEVPLCYYSSRKNSISRFEDEGGIERELEIVDHRPDNFSWRMMKKGYIRDDGLFVYWDFEFEISSMDLKTMTEILGKFEELKNKKYRLVNILLDFQPSKELISKLKAMGKKEQTKLVFKIKSELKEKKEEIMKAKKKEYELQELFSFFDKFPDAIVTISAHTIGKEGIYIGIGKSREEYGFSLGFRSKSKELKAFDDWKKIAIETFEIPSVLYAKCGVYGHDA
jgi:hypothetical protein